MIPFRFESSQGGAHPPDKLVWETEAGKSYDLWHSDDLSGWSHVDGFPKAGSGGEMEHLFSPDTRGFFKIAAEAGTQAPEGFVLIPAGTFRMGDANGEGGGDELPVHSVEVSGFHMAEHEVTKALWDDVRAWGEGHGYGDLPEGGGKAADHPVHSISWYAMVKWCNARSEKENLPPCYTVSGAVYRSGDSDEVTCDWTATGYRLPSEAEWEKAVRGGETGTLFPWGGTISHTQANYWSWWDGGNPQFPYDVSPTEGYHPTYNDGRKPYTSTVGSFAPNGYGLYDMAGNIWEWCWDWAGSYSEEAQTDPRGPDEGATRVLRGGGWDLNALRARCAARNSGISGAPYNDQGFRLARSLP